ncbi:pleiotropic drug resistance protein 6-like [Dorcoceras hygrometricum]|uniref:Pleiotropic drug resistance protein 6-like n=1 Tax=Dorcoceras hygrometricum TaxID=472368 RepID=A0A2Z7BHP6_9LAMI|nr:pleiotropic drug resistance protein 6-like [Dorcoceras hygrometricum]
MKHILSAGANTPAADFLALTKTTSPPLIQTTAYCNSLQELASNRYHPTDTSQNVAVLDSLALSAEIHTAQGRCLRTPHQLQVNVRKAPPNEASQQEESNATTLALVGAAYR